MSTNKNKVTVTVGSDLAHKKQLHHKRNFHDAICVANTIAKASRDIFLIDRYIYGSLQVYNILYLDYFNSRYYLYGINSIENISNRFYLGSFDSAQKAKEGIATLKEAFQDFADQMVFSDRVFEA